MHHLSKLSLFVLTIIVGVVTCTSQSLYERQPYSLSNPPKYINNDGTIDIVDLVAASSITPTNLPPTYPSNYTVDTSNSSSDAVQQSQQEQHISNRKRLLFGFGCPSNINIPSTLGNVFVPQGLSASLFSSLPSFSSNANSANATIGNYTQVYKNLKGTYSNPKANSFLGMSTIWSYNPSSCAQQCTKLQGCMSFEIYYERDPLVDPTVSSFCSNPVSITNIVCSFYGTPISSSLATNSGSTIGGFQIVKAGVDGYSLNQFVAPTISGYVGAVHPGLVDNRITTGAGSSIGPQYANYTTYSILYTSILTKNAYFNPIFCKAVADTVAGTKSFSTWQSTVGGDPNSTPFAGAGGSYVGQGCLLYSIEGFPPELFDNDGQFGYDPNTGNQNAFYSAAPNFHYDMLN